jgi:hypothetical protein
MEVISGDVKRARIGARLGRKGKDIKNVGHQKGSSGKLVTVY